MTPKRLAWHPSLVPPSRPIPTTMRILLVKIRSIRIYVPITKPAGEAPAQRQTRTNKFDNPAPCEVRNVTTLSQMMQQSQGNGHGTQKQNRPGHRLLRCPPRSANSASLSGCGLWGSGSLFACVNFHSGRQTKVLAEGIITHGLRSGWLRRVQRVKLDGFGLPDGRRAVGVLRGRGRHGSDVDDRICCGSFVLYVPR